MFRQRGTFESCACVMARFVYAWACASVASENLALTKL